MQTITDMKVYLDILEFYLKVRKQISQKLVYNRKILYVFKNDSYYI